ncbi:MAG: HDIG domain-containing protein [Gemmatimonadetes bacterium]|nr:HDIG domain-containing protein [Gemmatimonadota bacterium]
MSRPTQERGVDSVLYRLSGDPGQTLGERIFHHGARIGLLVGLSVLVTVLFPPAESISSPEVDDGTVAAEDIIATIPFDVPKSAAELAEDRREEAALVPPTFQERLAVGDTVASRLGRFFARLDSAAAGRDTTAVEQILTEHRVTVDSLQFGIIFEQSRREALRNAAQRAALEVIPRGMADPAEISDVSTDVIYVQRGDDVEETREVGDVMTSRELYAQAGAYLPSGSPPGAQELLRRILISHLEYSLVPNIVATEQDREAARASVSLIKDEVLQGEAIVRAADPVGAETIERVQAYQNALRDQGLLETERPVFGAWVGSGLLTFILLSIFGLLIFFSRPQIYANYRWLLLLALLSAAYFGAARGIVQAGMAPEWLPIAFVGLPVAVLWDMRTSLLLVLVLAALTGTLEPFAGQYGVVLTVMAGGAAAAMSVRAVRRRAETWVSIALIVAAGSGVSLAYGLATAQPLVDVAAAVGPLTGNTMISALLAVGFLWVFELFTGITTEQTLLEWADPTRPLLRRLSMEAPGTYAHTINVANLAEAAAQEISANGLLCRVGVLYHDVGKMLKPHYFVENQPDSRNPHDKLKPETSASIVREHVTEGVRLAEEAGVPDIVIDFILEHHGTQRIGFFYEKAREESEEPVDATRFSYPGPKPQSRETAIVMLADSCESAARAMRDPTPERVRDLIEMVVSGKLADGQLDEAPVTLGEITRIKDQFVKILGGVVHRRIEYPETKHLTEADSAEDEQEGAGSEDRDADTTGRGDDARDDDVSLRPGHSYADSAPGRAPRALDDADAEVPGKDDPAE